MKERQTNKYKYKFSFIMPLYDVEAYVAESVESVINQSIDFKANCEIIFVNDGSPDNVERICLEYKNKYPDNITYIKQKNAGPGAARNRGIKKSRGKYISLLDPDDKISQDTLEQVYAFMEEHTEEVDFVAIKLKYFEAKQGDHHLNYKFGQDRVIDLDVEYDHIQMSAATAFFQSDVLKSHLFDESVGRYAEDAHLMGRILLSKRRYGVLKEPTYLYRKRFDESSSLGTSKLDKNWYFETMEKVWGSLLVRANEEWGQVPAFIQYMAAYEIQWRLRQKDQGILSDDELDSYRRLLVSLLSYIDDVVIRQLRTPIEHKLLMLSMKSGQDISKRLKVDKDGDYSLNKQKIYTRKKIKFALTTLEVREGKLLVEGWHSGFRIKGIKFFMQAGNKKIYLDEANNQLDTESYSLGDVIYRRHAFSVRHKLSTDDQTPIRFGVESGQKNYISDIYKISPSTGFVIRLPHFYIYDSDKKFILTIDDRKTILIKPATFPNLIQQEKRYLASVYRINGIKRALLTPLEQIHKKPRIGAPLRVVAMLINPGYKRISLGKDLRYGQLFKPPQTREFHLGRSRLQSSIRVAAIMDDFTYSSFEHESEILQVTPRAWKTELRDFKPDLLFIESAWRGKDGLWRGKVADVSPELQKLVVYCRQQSIPVIFWNKEDPAHTFHFMQTASLCDYIFTTDSESIDTYRRILGHSRIFVLPFAAQPKIHHPIEKYAREDKFNFAGSYYPQYEERCRNFKAIVDAVTTVKGLDIYDRNYRKVASGVYRFTGEYEKYVRGSLPYSEIDKAYKGYRYAITMNTIKHSPTMFARRAFELLASNTITVGNYSKAIKLVLGDLTVSSDDAKYILKQIESITKTKQEENAYRLMGLRKVFAEHTYEERLNRILRVVFNDSDKKLSIKRPLIAYVGYAKSEEDIEKLKMAFKGQAHQADQELILCEFNPRIESSSVVAVSSVQQKGLVEIVGEDHDIVTFQADAYYGRHYVTDLVQAMLYSDVEVIGKATYYDRNSPSKQMKLKNDGLQYRLNVPISIDRALLRSSLVTKMTVRKFIDALNEMHIYTSNTLAIDEFNYMPHIHGIKDSDKKIIEGKMNINTGMSIVDIYKQADSLSQDKRKTYKAILLKKLHIVKTYPAPEDF